MVVIQLYRQPGLGLGDSYEKLKKLQKLEPSLEGLCSELCFNVEVKGELSKDQYEKLRWILSSPQHPDLIRDHSNLLETVNTILIEIGPRLNFSTAFSSNAVSICKAVGITKVSRIEVSTRYLLCCASEPGLYPELKEKLVGVLYDRMTQCHYPEPINSFELGVKSEPWFEVDIVGKGRKALEDVNEKLGLAFDQWDLDFYTELFGGKLKRNPTSVECFDLAQSNSEHSRHWFFKGNMIIDGEEQPKSLLDMIIETQKFTNPNNVIKFSDNSSAIQGYEVKTLRPKDSKQASEFQLVDNKSHIIFTAETHNFPTGVAPFSGATTGTGGRIRDVHAVGRGGHYIAGTAGYSFGNLLIPGYNLPWEDKNLPYPGNFAPPLEVAVEASNGASDYGNKFGEPLICGFARSYGQVLTNGERREYVKPIMFSGGAGVLDAGMVNKLRPEKGMQVVKLGGPVYRIGVGGGAASSVEVQGDNKSELDFGAVQRGDAEMEQKLHRVIRACLERGEANPICSIHDQGAGGNGNVLKELVEPEGAVIFTKRFQLGDPTISVLELWGAEYQENDALLCREEDQGLLSAIARRERCPINFVGRVTGSGKIILSEDQQINEDAYLSGKSSDIRHPVELDLELVLGNMPRKEYRMTRSAPPLAALTLPQTLTVRDALERVLRLPSVASKRYLTNKVDRCVTGLIAQQQCVGPFHTPLADVAVTALSHFNTEGLATAIGEQPIKGLISPTAGARMTVAESLTNLALARISDLKDVKCSGNWMWAAKLPGEGAALYDACKAMCELMNKLGVGVDGGKDSLSMAARVNGETIKAPGTLVVSSYAPSPDIRQVVTPDLKAPNQGGKPSSLLLVDLSGGTCRLGGSALAQCYKQLGDESPDVDNPMQLASAFNALQSLIAQDKILSGHDISDGGLVTCLLEMAFAGYCGLEANISHKPKFSAVDVLFAEELGWILEINQDNKTEVMKVFEQRGVPCFDIGHTSTFGQDSKIKVIVNSKTVVEDAMISLFMIWEETSYQLELFQTARMCAKAEYKSLKTRQLPSYKLTFDLFKPPSPAKPLSYPVRVAVLREEGINGDREMAASLMMAGFEVWDLTVQDLLEDQRFEIEMFRGLIFPGGFSYADVLGSAKGWAASLLFHPSLHSRFQKFAEREDTFSLGVCNGCQLMALLGWVGSCSDKEYKYPFPDLALEKNRSERFECRFSTVKIEDSPAIMLQGMAGTQMGVWVAHGEGRFAFKNKEIMKELQDTNCFALKYVDDEGNATEKYPFNPNGSPGGLAGICSPCGRHLAMMPHPERCTVTWQWPWAPMNWHDKKQGTHSPWLRIFQNAHNWCCQKH